MAQPGAERRRRREGFGELVQPSFLGEDTSQANAVQNPALINAEAQPDRQPPIPVPPTGGAIGMGVSQIPTQPQAPQPVGIGRDQADQWLDAVIGGGQPTQQFGPESLIVNEPTVPEQAPQAVEQGSSFGSGVKEFVATTYDKIFNDFDSDLLMAGLIVLAGAYRRPELGQNNYTLFADGLTQAVSFYAQQKQHKAQLGLAERELEQEATIADKKIAADQGIAQGQRKNLNEVELFRLIDAKREGDRTPGEVEFHKKFSGQLSDKDLVTALAEGKSIDKGASALELRQLLSFPDDDQSRIQQLHGNSAIQIIGSTDDDELPVVSWPKATKAERAVLEETFYGNREDKALYLEVLERYIQKYGK